MKWKENQTVSFKIQLSEICVELKEDVLFVTMQHPMDWLFLQQLSIGP